jgi:hypothetical protein
MNNLKEIDADELASIRIALMDKIDNMNKYKKDCEKLGNYSGKYYWEESIVKHTKLLNKLY